MYSPEVEVVQCSPHGGKEMEQDVWCRQSFQDLPVFYEPFNIMDLVRCYRLFLPVVYFVYLAEFQLNLGVLLDTEFEIWIFLCLSR